MSRQNPMGFGFSVLVEIAAVVAIVSFLPRIDLRPPGNLPSGQVFAQVSGNQPQIADPPISQVGWTPIDIKNGEAMQTTSHYERPLAPPPLEPTPKGSFSTQAPAAPSGDRSYDSKYVEDRLDRASQRLVNSVGSAVTGTANNLLPSATAQGPQPTTVRRPRSAPSAASTSQPRPWLRY